ncbi:V-type proton ATPase subunit E [archaeon HR01]|nr:V-type proton ATPase subunit E [archaeon HR01]
MSSAALEKVVREVVEDTLRRVREEIDSYLAEALKTVERVEQEAAREASAIASTGAAARESARQRIISLAEISAKNKSIAVVEEAVKAVFDKAFEEIAARAGGGSFKEVLRRLLLEAVDALGGGDLVVESNAAGIQMLQGLAPAVEAEKGVKLRISKTPIKTVAGVRVSTVDGSKIYDNTVEARLERLRPTLRKEIAALFLKE